MKITKFGHCCLLIEENGLRILTDPGMFTTAQNELTNLDVILVTHEHGDHFHVTSLKQVLQNNPDAEVITNRSVGALLDKENITYQLINDKETVTIKDILIEAFEAPHALVYQAEPDMLNTGFFIAEKLFYPGDALIQPGKAAEVLACPTAGPWLKLAEALDYAKAIKPKKLFPVHDAVLSEAGQGFTNNWFQSVLKPLGIDVIVPEPEKEFEV